MISISRANTLPTTGIRCTSSSQPDQPMSCRRCTPMKMPITTAAILTMPSANMARVEDIAAMPVPINMIGMKHSVIAISQPR